jgi:hypothetical protein
VEEYRSIAEEIFLPAASKITAILANLRHDHSAIARAGHDQGAALFEPALEVLHLLSLAVALEAWQASVSPIVLFCPLRKMVICAGVR